MTRTRSTKAARKRNAPRYHFDGIADTPRGASFSLNGKGIFLSAPSRNIPLGLLLTGICIGIVVLFFRALEADHLMVPWLLWSLLGLAFAVLAIAAPAFLFGRISLLITDQNLYIKRSVFGIGFRRKLPLAKIVKVRLHARRLQIQGPSRGLDVMFPGFPLAKTDDYSILVETKDREVRIGTNMKGKLLHYLHYVLVDRLREFHGQKKKTA